MKMKTFATWLISALLLGTSPSVWAKNPVVKTCFVAQFKSLALRTHGPQLRAQLARDWLERHAASCTDVQLSTLLANSPNWLGSALTLEISSILEGAIEAKIAGNPELMAKLYESLGKEGQAPTMTTYNTPTPRTPVVRPMVNTGVMAGSPNFGSITGNNTVNQNNNALSNTVNSNAANTKQNASPEAR
jgi:hypothetical protein